MQRAAVLLPPELPPFAKDGVSVPTDRALFSHALRPFPYEQQNDLTGTRNRLVL